MSEKPLTLSIVIPAYNEERYLPACLDAIARQTIKPDEVIVVDNNSTDKTAQIAKSYKFVSLLQEKRQHQTFAQIKGFENAAGDIFARIDADSILPPDWVKQIKAYMEDKSTAALTGGGEFLDVQLKVIASKSFHFYHNTLAKLCAGHNMLWGTNCAFRANLWPKINHCMLRRADIWEDYDLGFCLAPYGKIIYRPNLKVGCSFRSAHKSVDQLVSYQMRGVRTYWLRAPKWRALLFTLAWSSLIFFIPVAILDKYLLKGS